MAQVTVYSGARIFDGATLFFDHVLVVEDDHVAAIAPSKIAPEGQRVDLAGGVLAPGLLDLQVNGGGGAMLGAGDATAEIRTICDAHLRLGTAGLLPTLITATRDTVGDVLQAGISAARAQVPGFLGLHLEGPHLDPSRKGAHLPALIRPMDATDLEIICAAAGQMPALKVTVAPESVLPEQIAALTRAGVIVSLGHSDCSYDDAKAAFAAGARCVTHLYNAMSQLSHRAPGLVGAALDCGVAAGIIADLIHVSEPALGVAMRAKQAPERLFLVTDAMAVAGTDLPGFNLNERWIERRDGRLTLTDGTLAGADVTLPQTIANIHRRIGVELGTALRMATQAPADCIGLSAAYGNLHPGAAANFVHLGDRLELRQSWRAGMPMAMG